MDEQPAGGTHVISEETIAKFKADAAREKDSQVKMAVMWGALALLVLYIIYAATHPTIESASERLDDMKTQAIGIAILHLHEAVPDAEVRWGGSDAASYPDGTTKVVVTYSVVNGYGTHAIHVYICKLAADKRTVTAEDDRFDHFEK